MHVFKGHRDMCGNHACHRNHISQRWGDLLLPDGLLTKVSRE